MGFVGRPGFRGAGGANFLVGAAVTFFCFFFVLEITPTDGLAVALDAADGTEVVAASRAFFGKPGFWVGAGAAVRV